MRTLQIEVSKSEDNIFELITVQLEKQETQKRWLKSGNWKEFAIDCGATPEEIENASIEIEQL